MRRSAAAAAVCLALAAPLAAGTAVGARNAPLPAASADVHAGPVSATAGDTRVTLDISPKPVRPMRVLSFAVTAAGPIGEGPAWIDLEMPGMRMPPNRVRLAKGSDGTYRGSGTIVRCMSGRKTWRAAVTLPGVAPVTFTFDAAD